MRICVSSDGNTLHEATKITSSAKRWQGWFGRVWNALRSIVVFSGEQLSRCDESLLKKSKSDEMAFATRRRNERDKFMT